MVTPWLLGAGIIMGALAALAGLTDVIGEQRIRELNDVWLHAGGMVIVILIEIYNWYARYTEGAAAILPKGIILSLVVVCILLFAGWMGWNMVYRHRVGIADEAVAVQSSATPRRAASRLAWLHMTGKWPNSEISYINGKPSDTRWANLREVTSSQNRSRPQRK
jgi:hypothetical protein